ncbi:hypothetical protein [Rhizobium halophytocola]|uniref:Uncharacterized protein n=1 Tax=Rhizobium halophytocola TaxID=735519 RepID=A0ABS4E4I2_9HYPH|nr:hypothetical protein [Rhizobium halophytocola]MBP1852850.1 hypothetical protein [Rhizobium halophytocola]
MIQRCRWKHEFADGRQYCPRAMGEKMSRKVVDSNAMQSEALRSFLSASTSNYAVLNDYAAMEAYKGDTLISIFRSMNIVCEFPRQIIVLKTTGRICSLAGRARGLQRRMIEERQTRDFPNFCRRVSTGSVPAGERTAR